MKTVTRYESNDGHIWTKETDAKKRDDILKLANAANRILPSAVDESCGFANGGGYIQHKPEMVRLFTESLGELILAECGKDSDTFKNYQKQPRGIVGRYLDDGDCVAYKLWCRLLCIDDLNREWGQPSCVIGDKAFNEYKLWPNVAIQDFKPYRS